MSPPPAPAGFHHVSLVARDAARTLAFYRDLLGLDLVGRTRDPGPDRASRLHLGRHPGTPGALLQILEDGQGRAGRWGVGGVHHVALGVDDLAGLLRWKRRLTDAGLSPSGPIDRGYFQSLYFSDPDGQVLEIATHGPGYTLDEPARELDGGEMIPDPSRLPGTAERAAYEARTHPKPVPSVTPDMALTGIHHVSGITDNLEGAHDFYEGILGLRRVKRTVNQDDGRTRHWFWASYDGSHVAPHSSMTLFGWPGSDYRARAGVGQLHHIAFRAGGDEHLLHWRDHLRASGVDVTEPEDHGTHRGIRFSAPDGQLLELATDGPGFGEGPGRPQPASTEDTP